MAERSRERDRFARCEECGTEFVFTITEQRQAGAAAGSAPLPRLCPGCRALARRLLERKRRGRVKWFDRRKGFGFIAANDGDELFVHRSGLAEGVVMLRRGQSVEFQTRAGAQGAEACAVQPADARAADEDAA